MKRYSCSVAPLGSFDCRWKSLGSFQGAAESMGVELFNLAVVGDDPGTDVAGAHACDAAAILVKTGRFHEGALTPSMPQPDLILDSVATLPAALGVGF